MRHLFWYQGTFTIASDPSARLLPTLLGTITHALEGASAGQITVDGETVSFSAGLFKNVPRTSPLVTLTQGVIELEQFDNHLTIHYLISFRELLAYTLVLLLFSLLWWSLRIYAFSLVSIIALWLFVMTANMLIGIWRFRSLLKQSITQAGAVLR